MKSLILLVTFLFAMSAQASSNAPDGVQCVAKITSMANKYVASMRPLEGQSRIDVVEGSLQDAGKSSMIVFTHDTTGKPWLMIGMHDWTVQVKRTAPVSETSSLMFTVKTTDNDCEIVVVTLLGQE